MTASALTSVLIAGSMPILWAVLMAAAILAFALAVLLISGDKRSGLEKRLAGYGLEERGPDPMATTTTASGKAEQQLSETKFMEGMVGMTGRLADRVGLLNRVEVKL